MTATVVITGGSAGVGRAAARRFAADGARIGLIARGRERLQQAAKEAVALGGRALACPADVADPDAVEDAAARIEAELGPIDIWINAAMATVFGPLLQIEPRDYRRATEVTYLGCVHGTMAALRRMRPRDRGTIVQVGSALAYRSIPLQSAYCGAKHAIVGFTDSLRSELLHDGSRVKLCMVHLPAVNTPQFDWSRNMMPRRPRPVAPVFQPEVAAEALHHAAHHPRRELWLGRSTVKAILGQRLCPGLLDRILAEQAWDGQQTAEAAADHPDNLHAPIAGPWAAHGRFDAEARAHGGEFWLLRNGARLATGALALGLGFAAAAFLAAQDRRRQAQPLHGR